MIPDGERVTSDFLRAHPAVTALGPRIVGKTPRDLTTPWVRVIRLDGVPEAKSQPEHLISFLVQLDCYSGKDGGQPEANLLGLTVRAALTDDFPGVHDDAVVTMVKIVGDTRRPDTDLEPARERVVLTADIRIH